MSEQPEPCATFKYFTVHKEPLRKNRKTHIYWLYSVSKPSDILGRIEWYAPWRQYCFHPGISTVWNTGCLDDVQDFIKGLR